MEDVAKIDKIRSEEIRRRLQITSIIYKIKTQQLRWFRHIIRMEEDSFVKTIWEVQVGEKRQTQAK